ncbi:hypothetical protein Tco_1218511 [Tanacetum coccineum]
MLSPSSHLLNRASPRRAYVADCDPLEEDPEAGHRRAILLRRFLDDERYDRCMRRRATEDTVWHLRPRRQCSLHTTHQLDSQARIFVTNPRHPMQLLLRYSLLCGEDVSRGLLLATSRRALCLIASCLSLKVSGESQTQVNKARAVMSSASSAVTYTLSYHDLSRVGYFGELTRSCRTVVLHESSYTDTTRITMQHWAGPHLHKDYIPGSRGHKTTTSTPQDEDMLLSRIQKRIQRSMRMMRQRMVRLTIPLDGGEDGDDDDGDSPGDDTDDEDEDEEDEDEEDEEGGGALSSGRLRWERLARIASTQALIDAVTAALPSPPLPPLPPSLYIPPPVDRRDNIPESKLPPCKRSCLSTLGSRYEVRESSTARPTRGRGIDYGFVITVDAEARRRGIREVGIVGPSYHSRSTYLWRIGGPPSGGRTDYEEEAYASTCGFWAPVDRICVSRQSIMSFRPTREGQVLTRVPAPSHIRLSYVAGYYLIEKNIRLHETRSLDYRDWMAEL